MVAAVQEWIINNTPDGTGVSLWMLRRQRLRGHEIYISRMLRIAGGVGSPS